MFQTNLLLESFWPNNSGVGTLGTYFTAAQRQGGVNDKTRFWPVVTYLPTVNANHVVILLAKKNIISTC